MPASSDPGPEAGTKRWQFLRDVAVFQFKLVVDGLRDAVLVPLSLGAALVDLVAGGPQLGRRFYTTVVQGRRSERWIDLFEAADRVAGRERSRRGREGGLDDAVARLEALLVEQHQRGGVTASAKQAIDRMLDGISVQAATQPDPRSSAMATTRETPPIQTRRSKAR